jgi:transketolase
MDTAGQRWPRDRDAAAGRAVSDVAGAVQTGRVTRAYRRAEPAFGQWDKARKIVDELIDLSLNYRQSGHPGGSRSKVHLLLATLLSGAMSWDLLRPWRPFQDRFVLSAGHTVPVVYATLALLNEAVLARYRCEREPRFAFPDGGRWALTGEDLLGLRRRGGLPGHAEMAGKTLFLKFNTGPSGHGMPPAAGEALALKLAGADGVKVFCVEGEGGLTTGAAHETKNSAFGLGLSDLVFLIDWNDFGIDERAHSSVVAGTPQDWFAPAGWRVVGTEDGMDWGPVTEVVLSAAHGDNPLGRPTAAWFKTRKGRGYGKADAASHGAAWPMNSPEFWARRKAFMAEFAVGYHGVDAEAPADADARQRQAAANIEVALSVLRADTGLVEYLSGRIAELAAQVPAKPATFRLGGGPATARLARDPAIFDATAYPAQMWRKPGERAANRGALAAWGAYVNAYTRARYDRPLFIACSADLAESTNIAGFAADWQDLPGYGWYERDRNPGGVLLPQQITEFTNAGMMAGLASVNFADDPFTEFTGLWGACSTYGSFTYLSYGPLRLFSQLAQDCELRVGKVLYVAGHSGPETAEDSRTHFGIYEPGIMQLFPGHRVIDVHPWEYNEVPVVLAAALSLDVPIVALHLTRPAVEIPDRHALGMASHFEAGRGAYLIRGYRADRPRHGTVVVRGTVPTANLVSILPEIDAAGLNVKIVAAISPQLFARQDVRYQSAVLSGPDRWDTMVISNGALAHMADWHTGPLTAEYSLTPDWDGRWRTGGTLDEVMDEARLTAEHIFAAIERFAVDRGARLWRLRDSLDRAAGGR